MIARLRSERGAILLQAGTLLLTFTVVSILVIDHGMVLVSRHQIQTAADAAALAGATALTFDDYNDHSASGPAARAAMAVARSNAVWQEEPVVTGADVTFPFCPDSNDAGPTASPIPACIQVQLFRNAAHGNPLPSFVGQLVGAAAPGVVARAMAESRDANATDCLKPIAVPDRWIEKAPALGPWEPTSTFVKWDPANPTAYLSPRDTYTEPTWISPGTGVTLTVDFGAEVTLTPGTTAVPVSPISPWNYVAVQIPGSQFANDLRANVSGCAKSIVAIRDQLPLAPGGFA